MPAKYIYEPWTAPKSVQEAAGCIIGKDYPAPIVDHAIVMKENMAKMKLAYAAGRADDGVGDVEGVGSAGKSAAKIPAAKRQKQ